MLGRADLQGLHPETMLGVHSLPAIMLCISVYGLMTYDMGAAAYPGERSRNHTHPLPRMAPYIR